VNIKSNATLEKPGIPPRGKRADFEFFTGPLKAVKGKKSDGADAYFIEGIASSTVQDRQGDAITPQALVSMCAQAQGMTIFFNHSYNVPEDVLGHVIDASVEAANDPQMGGCYGMRVRTQIDESDPRAMKTWSKINGGTKLAYSIGGMFTEMSMRDPKAGETPGPWYYDGKVCEVSGMDLLEISCVGIPAQQRAIVSDAAAKALIAKSLGGKVDPIADEVIAKDAEPVNALAEIEKAQAEKAAAEIERVKAEQLAAGAPLTETEDEVAKELEAKLAEKRAADEAVPVNTSVNTPTDDELTAESLKSAEREAEEIEKSHNPTLLAAIEHGRNAAQNGNLCEACAPQMQKALGVMNKCYDSGKEMSEANVTKCLTLVGDVGLHGANCGQAHPCVTDCWKSLKNLLPPGYEGDPQDPDPIVGNPPGAGEDKLVIPVEAKVDATSLETVTASIEQVLSTVREAQAKAQALTEQVDEKGKELEKLEARIAELKATRTGRFTAQNGGAQGESGIPTAAEMAKSSQSLSDELARKLQQAREGKFDTDGRSRSDS